MIRTSHVLLAVLLHVVVIGMLLIGFRCTKKVEPPPVMQATLIDSKPQGKPAPPKPEPPPEPEPPKPEPPKPEPPKPEPPKPDPKIEEEREKQEQQRIEEQRRAEQQAQIRLQEEKKKEEKRKREEEKRKQKEEQARKEKQKREEDQKLFEDALRREENQRNEGIRATKQQLWAAQIEQKVRQNWLRPPGMADNFQCQLRVQLLPGGQVIGVQITKSCGNPILDDSVERAVRRSDPLPKPEDPTIFERELNLTFIP